MEAHLTAQYPSQHSSFHIPFLDQRGINSKQSYFENQSPQIPNRFLHSTPTLPSSSSPMNGDNISSRTRGRSRPDSPQGHLRNGSPANIQGLRQRSQSPPKKKQRTVKSGSKKPKKEAPKLAAPLSELTKDMVDISIKDMESWVHRPIEERRLEVEKLRGKVNRPMNSFMLYRSAYADRTKAWCTDQNHQTVSTVCGVSWKLEPPALKNYYGDLAKIERVNHQIAHPDYKFQPSKPKGKGKSYAMDEDSEDGEEDFDDDDPDGDWGTTHRVRGSRTRNGGRDMTANGMRADTPGSRGRSRNREELQQYQQVQEYEAAADSFQKAPQWDMRQMQNLTQLPNHIQDHVTVAGELYPITGSYPQSAYYDLLPADRSRPQTSYPQFQQQYYQYPQQYLACDLRPASTSEYVSRVQSPIASATTHQFQHHQQHRPQQRGAGATSSSSGFVGLPGSASNHGLLSISPNPRDISLQVNALDAPIDPSIMAGNSVYVIEPDQPLSYSDIYGNTSSYATTSIANAGTAVLSPQCSVQLAVPQMQGRVSSPIRYQPSNAWKPDTNDDGDALGVASLGMNTESDFESMWQQSASSIYRIRDEESCGIDVVDEQDGDELQNPEVIAVSEAAGYQDLSSRSEMALTEKKRE